MYQLNSNSEVIYYFRIDRINILLLRLFYMNSSFLLTR
nr:MAG TPA: hypothetical protein [Bacteriophage sp.]